MRIERSQQCKCDKRELAGGGANVIGMKVLGQVSSATQMSDCIMTCYCSSAGLLLSDFQWPGIKGCFEG